MDGSSTAGESDDSYRVVTFHPHHGAPPTLAMSELHQLSRRQVAMRAVPDLADDPGAMAIALDTDEIVEALGSICEQLDDDATYGAVPIHGGQIVIHWYLHSEPDEQADWLPDDVRPDDLVVWWATPAVEGGVRLGPTGVSSMASQLLLPIPRGASALDPSTRINAALVILNDLSGMRHAIVQVATLTHDAASIGLGPSCHLRITQAVASDRQLDDTHTEACLLALQRADTLAERVFPTLSGMRGNDPRREALIDAVMGWLCGWAMASELRRSDLLQLVAPVSVSVHPESLRAVDSVEPFATMIESLLRGDPRVLRTLQPVGSTTDAITVNQARRRLTMALACEHFAGLYLSDERGARLRRLVPEGEQFARVYQALVDLTAAAYCAEIDPSLATLRPGGLPDDVWDRWASTGRGSP